METNIQTPAEPDGFLVAHTAVDESLFRHFLFLMFRHFILKKLVVDFCSTMVMLLLQETNYLL